MDISRLARENELMKDYIHVNEILIDMILERRRAMAILNHYELPDFKKDHKNKFPFVPYRHAFFSTVTLYSVTGRIFTEFPKLALVFTIRVY
jgi:ABC-type siderophore export system fused ATPase/permease subunit